MIKDKIIEIRQKNRLKQAQFGKILNLTPDQVSRIERGKQEVDLKMLRELAEHFDVNLQWLIMDEVVQDGISDREKELEIENRVLREMLQLPLVLKKKA
jgi:transcriptional regulator with XRE-family HTH domain